MVARTLFYAGWALGVLGLMLSFLTESLGAVMILAGVLLIFSAFANLAREIAFEGNRLFLNFVVVLVGLGWTGFGVAVALG